MPGRSTPASRPTQAERRAATSAALIDGAASSLVERGHGGLTTAEVARRAGVSEGAVFRYFPTKQDLLAATAAHLYDTLLREYVDRFSAASEGQGPADVERSVALLWEVFASDAYTAALELEVAARTNPELRARLADVSARHAANLRDEARALVPATATGAGALTLDLLLETMHGMALSRMVADDPVHTRRLLARLTDLATTALSEGSRPR